MFAWIQRINKRRALANFSKQWRFQLAGEYGFSVGGNLVSEFGYLLRYVTAGKLDSFKNFEAIADDFEAIDKAIAAEIRKPTPREAQVNMAGPAGARQNLENLRYIVESITKYVELAKAKGLPENPLITGP